MKLAVGPEVRPSIDPDLKEFWEGVQRREFLLHRCRRCGTWYFPATMCPCQPSRSFFEGMEWATASGRGRVFAFNVHRMPFHPAFAAAVPYVYALMELEEGPMFGSNIVGCPPESVRIGQRVQICYGELPSGELLPLFTPRGESA